MVDKKANQIDSVLPKKSCITSIVQRETIQRHTDNNRTQSIP